MSQKGVIHLTLPLLLVVAIIAGIILIASGVIKIPSLPFGKKEAKVDLKTEYKNPFKKETQFVNPFQTYKNPFVVNR